MNQYAVYYPGPCLHLTARVQGTCRHLKGFLLWSTGRIYRLLKNNEIKALCWVPVRARVYLRNLHQNGVF